MGWTNLSIPVPKAWAGSGAGVQMITFRDKGLGVSKTPFPCIDRRCWVSDRCQELITFSQCCKVGLPVLRETALSSAASLSREEVMLTFGEVLGRVLKYTV